MSASISKASPRTGPESVPVEILLVEDNPADIRLTREVLAEGKIANTLHVVNDGDQAIAYLKGEGEHAGRAIPDLILLDLNLPRRDGREVLADLKADPEFQRIPVVVLTTSRSERDILQSYSLHANCYISKPVDLHQFMDVVRSIEEFWLSVVRLPPRR